MEETRFEMRFGVTLAIFAAVLAINDLLAGRFGDDELQLSNEKTSSYLWYQSKGIKESLAEGQKDLVEAMLQGGVVKADAAATLKQMGEDLQSLIGRYKKEKKEILLGSKNLKPEEWSQEVDGKLGNLVGAKEIEDKLDTLGRAGDRFDMATLFLQLALVIGAIGLTMKAPKIREFLYSGMVVLGILGTGALLTALRIVL
jgi:hypothetical protein